MSHSSPALTSMNPAGGVGSSHRIADHEPRPQRETGPARSTSVPTHPGEDSYHPIPAAHEISGYHYEHSEAGPSIWRPGGDRETNGYGRTEAGPSNRGNGESHERSPSVSSAEQQPGRDATGPAEPGGLGEV